MLKEIKLWVGDKLEGTDRQMMTVCNSSSIQVRYIQVVPENSPSYLLYNKTRDFSQKLLNVFYGKILNTLPFKTTLEEQSSDGLYENRNWHMINEGQSKSSNISW